MNNEQLLMALSDMMDQKLEPVHHKLNCMESRMDRMEGRMDRIEGRIDHMEDRMNRMEGRMDKLESQVSALRAGQLETSKDIKKLGSRIEKANQLALDAWGRGVENRKWLETDRKTM